MTAAADAWAPLWDEARAASILEIAARLGCKLKHSGAHWIGACPAGCADTDGFIITPSKRLFLCRPSAATGDAIDLVVHVQGGTKADALRFITGTNVVPFKRKDGEAHNSAPRRNNAPPRPETPSGAMPDDRTPAKRAADEEKVSGILRRALPIAGTHAEAYLRARGITAPRHMTRDLLFVPDLAYFSFDRTKLGEFPAMIAVVRDADGKMTGLHATYLDRDEPRKFSNCDERNAPKKMHGKIKHGLVRFGIMGDKLVIGEGIETTLAAYALGIGSEDALFASCLGLGNFRNLDLLPHDVREVLFLADGSPHAVVRETLLVGGRRLEAQDRIVTVCRAPNGKDFNNLLLERPC